VDERGVCGYPWPFSLSINGHWYFCGRNGGSAKEEKEDAKGGDEGGSIENEE